MSLQRFRRVFAILLVLCAVFVLICDRVVANSGKGRTNSDVEKIPHRSVGLLLGCVRGVPGGGENPFFTQRVDAAAKLYHAGKIDVILVRRQ